MEKSWYLYNCYSLSWIHGIFIGKIDISKVFNFVVVEKSVQMK